MKTWIYHKVNIGNAHTLHSPHLTQQGSSTRCQSSFVIRAHNPDLSLIGVHYRAFLLAAVDTMPVSLLMTWEHVTR